MRDESSDSVRITFPAFSREELIRRLRDGVDSLAHALPVTQVVLFGSWATGRATAHSDIDLLVVYAGAPRDGAFRTVRRHVAIRGLEPHVYTENEARRVGDVLERMIQGGVSLLCDPPETMPPRTSSTPPHRPAEAKGNNRGCAGTT